jgi:hypothetical protein
VLADDLEKPLNLQLDATHLYHMFLGGEPGAYVNTIYKRALEVGAPLEQLWTREGTVRGFALSERYVWWVHQPTVDTEPPWDLSEIMLFRVAKAGGPAEVMIPGYVQSIVSSPQGLVTLRMNANLEGVNGTFQLLPWSGGVASDLCEYHGLKYVAANAAAVVWIDDQGIETCPLTGGATSPVHALDPSEVPVALAVDSTHAYWSTFVGIYRVPLAGGERETIAVHPDRPRPVSVWFSTAKKSFLTEDGHASFALQKPTEALAMRSRRRPMSRSSRSTRLTFTGPRATRSLA